MGRSEGGAELRHEAQGVGGGKKFSIADEGTEAASSQELHHKVGAGLLIVPIVVDLDDVRVANTRSSQDLAKKALAGLGVGVELGEENLDRDALADAEVLREIDRAHASAPDEMAEEVAMIQDMLRQGALDAEVRPEGRLHQGNAMTFADPRCRRIRLCAKRTAFHCDDAKAKGW